MEVVVAVHSNVLIVQVKINPIFNKKTSEKHLLIS